MTTPNEWTPQKPDDLLGIAGKVAKVQIKRARNHPKSRIRLLLYGEPGCGKSATCRIIANSIAETGNISHVSACQITADTIRGWIEECKYMRSGWRIYHIEECDAMNPTVQILMLQFLDLLPEMSAVLCTSNLKMQELSDRFQSRFQCIKINRPVEASVINFLYKNWPELRECNARRIAGDTKGDIRAALNDAQAQLDYLEYANEEEAQ